MHAPARCLQERFTRFGGAGSVSVAFSGARAPAALTELPGRLAAAEAVLSRFAPGSELVALNRTGRAGVSETLWGAIAAALAMAEWSDGWVTPTVAPALEALGYDRPYAEMVLAEAGRAAAPRPAADWRRVRMDAGRRRVTLAEGVRLDLGGSAKGWVADGEAARFGRESPALIELDGTFAASGPRPGGAPWLIPVPGLAGAARPVAFLALERGGVATAAPHRRRWFRGGQLVHHLVHPRTGLPADTDVASATVRAGSALVAQVAAKLVVLLGAQAGAAFLAVHPGISGVVVAGDGAVTEVSEAALRAS